MVRRVFFSFHFERDIWRANQVRNSWVTQDREAAGFWDESLWERARTTSEAALKRLIDDGLQGTSVTIVLIGAETASRKWVRYEISESHNRGNGLLGVYIHNLEDPNGRKDVKGENPFGYLTFVATGKTLSDYYPCYDWVYDGGYDNIGYWIEEAARKAGR